MSVAIINTKKSEVFILGRGKYYWGRNFAYAVEFNNLEQFKLLHPDQLTSKKKFKAVSVPEDMNKQVDLAEKLGLIFTYGKRNKGDRIDHPTYELPEVFTDRYYEREQVAQILGIKISTLKKLSTHMPLIRVQRHGKFRDIYYSTQQLHSLFVAHQKSRSSMSRPEPFVFDLDDRHTMQKQ